MAEDWSRPVVHWEIQAKNPEQARKFYSALFNWEIGEGQIANIGPGIGAPEPITGHIRGNRESAVVLYVQVLSLRASLDRAVELGGSILREPFDPPSGPTLAWLADPEGNQVVLVQQ